MYLNWHIGLACLYANIVREAYIWVTLLLVLRRARYCCIAVPGILNEAVPAAMRDVESELKNVVHDTSRYTGIGSFSMYMSLKLKSYLVYRQYTLCPQKTAPTFSTVTWKPIIRCW